MNSPTSIEIQAGDTPETAAAKITLQPDAIFLLLGSFDATMAAQVRSICARALIPVAVMAKALIVDDGLPDGLAGLMGQAAAQMDKAPPLLGILAPDTEIPDANHSQLLKAPAEWGDPIASRLRIIAELAKQGTAGEKPVIVVLFGGGNPEKAALLRCARRGWPIVIVRGARGLGDAIVAALAPPVPGSELEEITDPDLLEILDTTAPSSVALSDHVDDQTRVLSGPIQVAGEVLADAWCRYDDLDLAAIEKQDQFKINQGVILTLAIAASLLAVLISKSAFPAGLVLWLLRWPWFDWLHVYAGPHVHIVLHISLVLVPITISILVSYNSRFREGNKWILLRASAEAIKREIFRYRMRSGIYRAGQCGQISAQSKLAAKITDITSNLLQSEVNKSNVPIRSDGKEHTKPDKKGKKAKGSEGDEKTCLEKHAEEMKYITPGEYLAVRIDNQTTYFVSKVAKLYRQLKRLEICILLAGGLGTFLAAINMEVWVALTTALATAITTKLQIDQTENSIVQYNIALANLRNVESWWKALSAWERTRARNIDLLVDQTETILERETAGWIQQMQSELDKLSEKQASANQKSDSDSKK
jgi:SMODS and SLOG-associating 2TM effector domain 1/SLOG in TRPM, prokaryote/Protein of unknown function (DUF4231)